MRDIKFKVYCEKHNREEIYTLGDLVVGETRTENGEGGIFENWRQFTGLHDKNGKEIYEGDIVRKVFYKFSNDEFGHKGFYELICKIIWIGVGFTFRKIKENEITMPENYTEEYEEVIGNIYDNPELLERSSNGD